MFIGQRLFSTVVVIDPKLNRRLGFSDIPHRFVGTFLYDLPFGRKPGSGPSAVLGATVSGWFSSRSAPMR